MCGRAVHVTYRPFCSKRCADLDLGRWLREDYRIPAEEPPDGAEGDLDPNADEENSQNRA
ncbi:MAG: DNA gyrase inhibitor YacG [Alphaproteobacteria bacterium]|nr:DNA gyrase inhibitor YacG [Alphaproteobacteria bacterium]